MTEVFCWACWVYKAPFGPLTHAFVCVLSILDETVYMMLSSVLWRRYFKHVRNAQQCLLSLLVGDNLQWKWDSACENIVGMSSTLSHSLHCGKTEMGYSVKGIKCHKTLQCTQFCDWHFRGEMQHSFSHQSHRARHFEELTLHYAPISDQSARPNTDS